ncbi:MAG: Fur family transcriptional regulator [Verrucomicrobiota bacterium]
MSDDGARESFVAKADEAWKSAGGRLTVVRRIICESIETRDSPFDAETLLELAQKQDPLISLSSVYRTLKFLEDANLISHIDGLEGERLFRISAQDPPATSHIVCRDCGAILPMKDPCLSLRQAPGINAKGFYAEKISLRIEASCSEMAENHECTKRNEESS